MKLKRLFVIYRSKHTQKMTLNTMRNVRPPAMQARVWKRCLLSSCILFSYSRWRSRLAEVMILAESINVNKQTQMEWSGQAEWKWQLERWTWTNWISFKLSICSFWSVKGAFSSWVKRCSKRWFYEGQSMIDRCNQTRVVVKRRMRKRVGANWNKLLEKRNECFWFEFWL